MTEEAPPDVKKRRLSTTNTSPQGIRCIIELPTGILAQTASFLAAPSKALFAVTLDENSAVTINERSSAIVGNQWDTLDFGEIEQDLAEKLSDDDVEKVLLCIDAVNNVKRLKLANCTKITGTCLEPLRGSLIIEQIDLSLVDNHIRDLELDTPISLEHVLPILDSIIEREGCALMHLHFPSVWRKEPSEEPSTANDLYDFIGRYSQMFTNRGSVHCLECNRSLPRDEGGNWFETSAHYYGTQLHTCHGCLKHYCYFCNDGEGKKMLHVCDTCQRDYCVGCVEMTECSSCGEGICNDCYKRGCVECDQEFCWNCLENDNCIDGCDYCNKCYCQGCNDDDVAIHFCHRCNTGCCKDCLLHRYRRGQLRCAKCINRSVAMGERLERT